MTINYLFIDDDNGNSPESYIASLEGVNPELKIKRTKPRASYDEEVKAILAAYTATPNSFGLILDLRLNQDPNEAGVKSDYRGSSLAQEIRTRMTEGTLPRFPIVLWSMDNFLKSSYKNDNTSHDLFDRVYVKDKAVQNEPARVAKEMVSLVNGYHLISDVQTQKKLEIVLGCSPEELETIDPRILDELDEALKESTSDSARFLLNDLIFTESILSDDHIIAARLGISIENSNDSWLSLLKILESCRYTGAFSDGWRRWWSTRIDRWWFEFTGEFVTLKRVPATKRVEAINKKFSLNLVAANPIKEGYSEYFDTICQVYKQPIDSADAFRANCPSLKPWQTPFYLSIRSVLERKHRPEWRLHPLDIARLDAIKRD